MSRLAKLQQKIKNNKKINGLLVSNSANLNYLAKTTLFSEQNKDIGFFTSHQALFFVSPLIQGQIKSERFVLKNHLALSLKVISLKKSFDLYSQLKKITIIDPRPRLNYSKFSLGFEENDLGWKTYQGLKKKLKLNLIPTKNIIESLRIVKDKQEIKNIKKAISLTKKAFKFIKPKLKPGRTENQIAWQIEKFIKENGANLAFQIIVASGPNSAIPHYQTGKRKLKSNDIVLIDAGAKVNGYCADMTRTFFIGRPKPVWKKVFNIVKTAQKKAISYVNPRDLHQLKANRVDKTVRNYIKSQGFEKYFIHSTGHGIGLDIHEKPYISPKSKQTLKPGMVFTIEPGIYIKNKFGVRIEDTMYSVVI